MHHTQSSGTVGAARKVASPGTMGMGAMPNKGVLGVVLCIPWRGLFMCPLAVAGLRLRYLNINFSLIFKQPSNSLTAIRFWQEQKTPFL